MSMLVRVVCFWKFECSSANTDDSGGSRANRKLFRARSPVVGSSPFHPIGTEKRYDSIGSAPAGIVGVGSTLIPGHFRLGRLDEAAGVCGGRGPSMGFELGS